MDPEEFSEAPPVDPTIDPDLAPPEKVSVRDREDRRVVGEVIEEPESTEPVRLELTNQERQDFAKLLNVGKRTATVTVADHQVTIGTLKSADEMRIGLYTKNYLDTQGFARAYRIGVCAAGIVEIKGQELWTSLKEITDPDEIFTRNTEALEDFYPWVINQIYDEVMKLEREFAALALRLGWLADPAKK